MRGTVTLLVARTLVGEERKHLDLPCVFLKPDDRPYALNDYGAIWPDLSRLPQDRHLCVFVVPNTYDRLVPLDATTDSAASHVFVADDTKDKGFGWIEQIVGLHALVRGKDRPKLMKAIRDATVNTDKRVRMYADDVLAGDLIRDEPATVLKMLGEQTSRAGRLGLVSDGEAAHTLALIGRLVRDKQASPDGRREAAHTVARLVVDADAPEVSAMAVQTLAIAIADRSFATPNLSVFRGPSSDVLPFGAGDVLTETERAELKGALTAAAKNKAVAEAAVVDLEWLDRSPR